MVPRPPRRSLVLLTFLLLVGYAGHPPTVAAETADGLPALRFSEVVTDPQSDRDGGGKVTGIDEYVELHNAGNQDVLLAGWVVHMIDSTPTEAALEGTLAAGGHLVLLNPPGDMNNDVRLELVDDTGAVVDVAALGGTRDGHIVADGNAAGVLDEAVVLAGPWLGQRAAVTPGHATGEVWVAGLGDPQPMQDPWFLGANATLDVDLWSAYPVSNVTVRLTAGQQIVATANATLSGGSGRLLISFPAIDVTAAQGRDLGVVLEVDGTEVGHWPDGRLLRLLADPLPPHVEDEAVVLDGDGVVRWVPPVTDAHSGVASTRLVTTSSTNNTTSWGSPPCTFTEGVFVPAVACQLNVSALTNLHLVVGDTAGHVTNATLAWYVDTVAPDVPAVTFDENRMPSLRWAAASEPLVALHVAIAEDATGQWFVGNVTLVANATTWQDDTWVPGDPRAYRLVATDRAGHMAQGPWRALDPASVPVTYAGSAVAGVGTMLANDGWADLLLTFDRELVRAPRVVLQVEAPRPLWVEATTALAPDGKSVDVSLLRPEGFPLAGTGRLLVRESHGTDGAPLASDDVDVTWDVGAPHVYVDGASDGWVRAARHAITITATDATDKKPQIRLVDRPDGVTMRGPSDKKTVTVRGEGFFVINGTVEDDDDHIARFSVRLALDATPPSVALVAVPDVLDASTAVVVQVTDATSGVNASSLHAWAGWGDGVGVELELASYDGGEARFVLPAGVESGTLAAIHVAASDHAGNLAEGSFAVGGAQGTPGASLADDGVQGFGATAAPRGGIATAPSGPGWVTSTPRHGGAAGSDTSSTTAGLARWSDLESDDGETVDVAARDEGHPWGAMSLLGAGALAGLGTVVSRRRPTDGSRLGRETSGRHAGAVRESVATGRRPEKRKVQEGGKRAVRRASATRTGTRHPSRRKDATRRSRP